MRVALTALALLMAIAPLGCRAQAGAAAAPVDTDRVEMALSYRFEPTVIRVPVGTTVTWRNSDNFTHSVKVLTGDYPSLDLRPGQSGSITFDRPGEFEYICTYHAQNMKGKVIVVER